MRQVVKPLGKIIAIDTLPQPENESQELFLKRHRLLSEIQRRRDLHERFYEEETLREAFKLAGLSHVRIRIIQKRV